MKTISKTVSKGTQSVSYQEILAIEPDSRLNRTAEKLRIKIKSDAHNFQSYAHISVWRMSAGWTRVHTIPFGDMKTEHGLYYGLRKTGPGRTPADFKADRDELLRVALEVI